jgi:hypothetical protein
MVFISRPLPDPINPETAVTPLLELLEDYLDLDGEMAGYIEETREAWEEFLELWDGNWLFEGDDRHEWSQNEHAQYVGIQLRDAYTSLAEKGAGANLQAERDRLKLARNSAQDVLRIEKNKLGIEPSEGTEAGTG